MEIHYNTPMVADAARQIGETAMLTDQNHEHSLQVVTANAENFGGRASLAFQDAIAQVNHAYAQSREAIQAASNALTMSNDNMTQADQTLAGQYG